MLLFVKVCVCVSTYRICLHWDNMTSHIHDRNVLCPIVSTFRHCKYNTESHSPPLEMQSAVRFHSPSFPSASHLRKRTKKFSVFKFGFAVFFSSFLFHSYDASSFQLAAGEKHLSRGISFPKAFPDKDRWCPFKRSHGSVLFLVLTTHTDTEARWETHTPADVDTQWCLHLRVCLQTAINMYNTCKYTHNKQNIDVCAQTERWREPAGYGVSIYLSLLCVKVQCHTIHTAPFQDPGRKYQRLWYPPLPSSPALLPLHPHCFPAFEL